MKPSLFESSGFKADYEAVLVEPWSPYLGAILLLLAVLALMRRASSGACLVASSCGATG